MADNRDHGRFMDATPTDEPDSAIEGCGLDSAKARQIIDGARKAFLADGFDGASMNDVARVAGVSKGTIYAYFPSKEALFTALLREDRRLQAERLGAYDDHDGPVPDVLRRMGLGLMQMMLEPAHVAQVRTVTAAAAKFPAVGEAFYAAGPQFGQDRFAAWLRRKAAAGELVVSDFDTAAIQFFNLMQGALFRRMLFANAPRPADAEIEATVDAAASAFMAIYAPR